MPSRKKKEWTKEAMREALREINENGLSVRKAAEMFNIPKSTLADRKSGKIDIDAVDGKSPKFNQEDEKKLIDYAIQRSSLGIGFGKTSYLRYAGLLAEKRGIKFKNGTPSNKWWMLHKKRNPGLLSLRKAEPTSSVRHKQMNRENVADYFSALKTSLEENNLLESPLKIWNMDETSLPLSIESEKVVAGKGARHIQSKTGSKESVTIIACANAAGNVLSPHVIVKGKTKQALKSWDTENAPTGAKISVSDSGWTKQGLAELWFTAVFLPGIGPSRPQILVMDGHNSHNHVELLDCARQNNIILAELPAHTSHWLQPLDRTYFGPLKGNWRKSLSTFTSETGCPVTHGRFFHLFRKTWNATNADSAKIKNGFKSTGIYPFNPEILPEEAYLPSTLYTASSTSVTQSSMDVNTDIQLDAVDIVETDSTEANDLLQVMDLGISVDENGQISVEDQISTSNANVQPAINLQLPKDPNACPPELALAAVECSLTLQMKESFEIAYKTGKVVKDKMFETWRHYKQLVDNENSTQNCSTDDSDIFTIPSIPRTKSEEKKKYFILTCEEAFQEKVAKQEEKRKKEEAKAQRLQRKKTTKRKIEL